MVSLDRAWLKIYIQVYTPKSFHIGFSNDRGTCKYSSLLHLFDHSRKHVHRQQKYNFIVIKMNITPVLHVNLLCMVAILVTIFDLKVT